MPPTPPQYCKTCGNLQDSNLKFCSSCGSETQANPQLNVGAATSDVRVVKDRIKAPSIALIVSAGINLLFSFIILIYFTLFILYDIKSICVA